MAKTYRCKQSFALGIGGTNRVIRAGEIVAENDPRFRQHKHLFSSKFFESSDDYIERTVEQATAAPGEKRTVSRGVAARKATKAAAKAPESGSKPDTKDTKDDGKTETKEDGQ